MPRPKGSKNKPKEPKRRVGRPRKDQAAGAVDFELEEDIVKLRHALDRIPMLSDDGYRIKETISILKTFGFTSKQVKKFLTDGTIPLK